MIIFLLFTKVLPQKSNVKLIVQYLTIKRIIFRQRVIFHKISTLFTPYKHCHLNLKNQQKQEVSLQIILQTVTINYFYSLLKGYTF